MKRKQANITSPATALHVIRVEAKRVRREVAEPSGQTVKVRGKDRRLSGEACFPASEALTAALQARGVEARTAWGWVLLPDTVLRHHWTEAAGLVVDTTIDQLGPTWEPVLIQPADIMRSLTSFRYTEDFGEMSEHFKRVCGLTESVTA